MATDAGGWTWTVSTLPRWSTRQCTDCEWQPRKNGRTSESLVVTFSVHVGFLVIMFSRCACGSLSVLEEREHLSHERSSTVAS